MIYDSGMGGLTVLDAFVKRYPQQEFLYIGDTAYCPYGDKTEKEIQSRVEWILQTAVLPQKDISLLVLACNTISAWCKDSAQRIVSCPVIGTIEAAVMQAARYSKNKQVALWATEATVRSHIYETTGEKQGLIIESVSCSPFVPLMEHPQLSIEEKHQFLKEELQVTLRKTNRFADVLIYGCTHYPMLEPLLKGLEQTEEWSWLQKMKRINPAQLMVEQSQVIHTSRSKGSISWYITGDEKAFFTNARQWMKSLWFTEMMSVKQ